MPSITNRAIWRYQDIQNDFCIPIDFDANSKNMNAKLEKSFKNIMHKERKRHILVNSIFSYHYKINTNDKHEK